MAVRVVGASAGVNSSGVLASVGSSEVSIRQSWGSIVAVWVVGAGSRVNSSGPLTGGGGGMLVAIQSQDGVVAVRVVGAQSGVKSSRVLVSLSEDSDGASGQDEL